MVDTYMDTIAVLIVLVNSMHAEFGLVIVRS